VIDTLWVAWDPAAVRSPSEILLHHVASGILAAFTVGLPTVRPYWTVGAVVEVNTLFLIAHRRVQPGVLRSVLFALLLITWFPLRFGVPTAILWLCAKEAERGEDPILVAAGVLCGLVLLAFQCMWTMKLWRGLRAEWWPQESREGGEKENASLTQGL